MGRVVVEVSDELHLALKRRALEEGATVAELVRPALVALGSGPGGEGGDGTRSATLQHVHALTAHAIEPIPAPRRGVAPSGYQGPLDATGDAGDREAPGSTAAPSSPTIAGGAAGAEPVSPPTIEPGESAVGDAAAGTSGPGIALPARTQCLHPKDAERRLSWGTICGLCGEKIR